MTPNRDPVLRVAAGCDVPKARRVDLIRRLRAVHEENPNLPLPALRRYAADIAAQLRGGK